MSRLKRVFARIGKFKLRLNPESSIVTIEDPTADYYRRFLDSGSTDYRQQVRLEVTKAREALNRASARRVSSASKN
jgi:hypothetical protein